MRCAFHFYLSIHLIIYFYLKFHVSVDSFANLFCSYKKYVLYHTGPPPSFGQKKSCWLNGNEEKDKTKKIVDFSTACVYANYMNVK